jgi:glycosyltransferase involved in cell wall biosynthesis
MMNTQGNGMKIALFSYEFPPDTAQGGIATYFHQISRILSARGHHVEVFTGGWNGTTTTCEDGVTVHRLTPDDTVEHHVAYEGFHRIVGPFFAARHAIIGFDVIEGPELEAEAREALRLVPDIALVVKLHSPSLLLWRSGLLQAKTPALLDRIRLKIAARRLGMPTFWGRNRNPVAIPEVLLQKDRIERSHALDADEILVPSPAMGSKMVSEWGLDEAKIHHIPNPYIPSPELLAIPIETRNNVVTFLGRLQVLKGVIELALAIPLILRRHPNTKFRFVGGSSSCVLGDLQHYLKNFLLRDHADSVEFTGFLPMNEVPGILAATDICVFPSIWESFSNVCVEAMAAGRGVVGSSSGGMSSILGSGKVGCLVAPGDPRAIANAVNDLLADPAKRMTFGKAAREHVLNEYNSRRIGELQEASYARAMARRRQLGSRYCG